MDSCWDREDSCWDREGHFVEEEASSGINSHDMADIKDLLERTAKLRGANVESGADLVILLFFAYLQTLGFRVPGDDAQEPSLPSSWKSGQEAYAFKLRHPQSSFTFLIKGLVLGKQLIVHGLAEEVSSSRRLNSMHLTELNE